MSENKTQPTTDDANAFITSIDDPRRRADTAAVAKLTERITGETPVLWGKIIGFGKVHYKYASGREGDTMVIGIAPRKVALTMYGVIWYNKPELLGQLGPHTTGKGCLYIKDLGKIDIDVLGQLIKQSWAKPWTSNLPD